MSKARVRTIVDVRIRVELPQTMSLAQLNIAIREALRLSPAFPGLADDAEVKLLKKETIYA